MEAVLRAGVVLVMRWLAALFAAGTVLLAAGGAHAAPAGSVAGADSAAGADAQSQSAYLAEQLRRDPVYISDQLPRSVPRSTAPAFAAEAKRLHVPTYLVVLPLHTSGGPDSGLLAGIHDRLGRKGLYVSLSEMGLMDVQTYGVSVPGAQDAQTATSYEMPTDATPREEFRHFVDVLTSGQANQRADRARAAYGGAYNSHEPPALHTSRTDREDQSFLTGVAVTGVPLAALLIAKYAVRRRRLRREEGEAGSPGGRRWPLLELGALALAGLLAFTASQVFDDTTTGDGSVPTATDMRARVDRVAEGLRHDPLYVDPESPSSLDAGRRAELRKRIGALPVPVLVTVVPTSTDDESQGDEDRLAKALHDRLHRDALFVFAEPTGGGIQIVNYGTPVDSAYLYGRPRDLVYTDPTTGPLGSQLDKLLTYLSKAPKSPHADQPYPPRPAPDPAAEQRLPGLFSGDFRAGLFIGGLAALLLFGLVVAVWALVRSLVRGRARSLAAAAAPIQPRKSWLRRTAREEVAALTGELEAATELPEKARRRAWECLDAAALLVDGDSDGLIDDDATPASLACAIVLARAGRAAVREPSTAAHICHRNPLHGTAVERAPKPPAGSRRAPRGPVCAACLKTPGEMLRLYGADDSGRQGYGPYPEHPGPLASLAKGAGIDQLTREVRESFGVH
ncbi:hypothetical protein [Streptomyces yunnanensis]|uniref:DUF4350 domain-containing protein n=1 Tax=Streptomyces yunnanensis TaxID=156453 RepID=A0A9X8MYN2_9ACTN|nr:hypothetical protein [Streptomyces yunnanensis]SHM32656.1 hypothetical protein SAMN05216268_11062 [Streptomyces yunnanensis]